MEVPTNTLEEINSRLQAAAAAKSGGLEVELRWTDVNIESLSRLLSYADAHFLPAAEAPSETLDVIYEVFRVTLVDEPAMLAYASGASLLDAAAMCRPEFIRKEPRMSRHTLPGYPVAVSGKQETPQDDTLGIIARLSQQKMLTFRRKRRWSYTLPDKPWLRLDATVVRQATGPSVAALITAPETYEVELEVVGGSEIPGVGRIRDSGGGRLLLAAAGTITAALQGCHTPMSASRRQLVLQGFAQLCGAGAFRNIAPQPVTAERLNLLPGGCLRALPYTATDKADGSRQLLFFDVAGRGFLIGRRQGVRSTGLVGPKDTILDGELVADGRNGDRVDLYLVFDAYYLRGRDVRALPLAAPPAPGEPLSVSAGAEGSTRLSCMHSAVSALDYSGAQGGPVAEARVKRFAPLVAAREVLMASAAAEYHTDGLILTPLGLGVFQESPDEPAARSTGTWFKALKWKPPEQNSVDLRVVFDKTPDGVPILSPGGLARAQLMALVAGSRYGTSIDPYEVLVGGPRNTTHEAPFRAPAYSLGDSSVYVAPPSAPCAVDGLLVEDNAIVEFTWTASGWSPLRRRVDKEFPNLFDNALAVWNSIAFPITADDLVDPSNVVDEGAAASEVYFAADADGKNSWSMRVFHSHFIKTRILYAAGAGNRLLDLACGVAGDLWKWSAAGFRDVLGVDIVEDNLVGSRDGAYLRLSKANLPRTLKYIFLPMDASKPLGMPPHINSPGLHRIASSVLRAGQPDQALAAYTGMLDAPFDCVSVMFAIHYFFASPEALDGLVENVARHISPGGRLIGACLDGAAVDQALAESPDGEISGHSDGALVWRIRKQYEGRLADRPPGERYGLRVAVFIDSIGQEIPEYLVDFDLLTERLARSGLDLASSASFRSAYNAVPWAQLASGRPPEGYTPRDVAQARIASGMTEHLRRYSFLNRYFVFTAAGTRAAKDRGANAA